MTDKMPKSREMRLAEDIMFKDRDILQALASSELDEQIAVAREVMGHRKLALNKLAK